MSSIDTNFLVRWLFRSWKQCGKLNWDIKFWWFSKLKLEQPCWMLISCLDENAYAKFLKLNLKKPHWIVTSLVVNENSYVKLKLKLKPHWILMYINNWNFIPLNSKTSVETFTIIKTSSTIIGNFSYHNLGLLKLKRSLNSKMELLPYVKNGNPILFTIIKPWIGWIGFSFLLRRQLITKVGTKQKETSGE